MSTSASNTTDAKGKGKRRISASPPPDKRRHTESSTESKHTYLSYKDLPSDWTSERSDKANETKTTKLTLKYNVGNMFSAPTGCLLIHACNTQGSWGAGIAKAFKERYPEAYKVYHNFCAKEHSPKTGAVPTGTALLIPPVDGHEAHWIGCLFTSAKYGKGKDKPDVIVRNTTLAMEMLLALMDKVDGIAEVRMCKINSGKFGVPWEKTSAVLEAVGNRGGRACIVHVWEPEET
ncbi:ADP-ribose 1''-phosphate phosphatase [Coniothyrium glycines]